MIREIRHQSIISERRVWFLVAICVTIEDLKRSNAVR
jgi:hypothetical protein